MAFTYDPTTNLGKVRNLIGDTVDSGHILEDADINAFISMANTDLYKAASFCLYRIAATQALLAKVKKAGDYMEDLRDIAENIRAVAKEYAGISENTPAEAQAESFVNDFSYRDVITRKDLRGEDT